MNPTLRRMLETAIQLDLGVPQGAPLTSDMSVETVRRIMLRNSIFKKFEDVELPEAETRAIETFKNANARCGELNLDLLDSFQADILGMVCRRLWELFDPMSMECSVSLSSVALLNAARTGPGASLGAKCYNFYTKLFDSDLTCTDEKLYSLYTSTLRLYGTDTWVDGEHHRQTIHGHRIVESNKLSTVPKNVDTRRTICTEPNLNMFYQLGLGNLIRSVLTRRYNIDLEKQQEINRGMARQGSIDTVFCTIDLKSASDTIANSLIEAICPPKLYGLVQLLRSKRVNLPDGSDELLHMVSSMGNGFTFPLQTLVFATIVEQVYHHQGIALWKDGVQQYSVYGDDIIVVRQVYHTVVSTLESFGFIVNHDKSFSEGYFRESCGADYWLGYLVRGIYIRSLATQPDINTAYNQLYLWQESTGIQLSRSMKLLRLHCKNYVPRYCDLPAGFYREEWQPHEPYKEYIPVPLRFAAEKLPYHQDLNPDGLLTAFLGGYITAGTVSLRREKARYQLVTRKFPRNFGSAPKQSKKAVKGLQDLRIYTGRTCKRPIPKMLFFLGGLSEN